jgi:hypothetical protein
MKDKLEKLEELLNSTKKRVKETKEKEEEVRKVKEKFIESRSVKSIYLVGVTDVNKSDYYSVRNLFGEIFRGINRELIEIAKKEFKETPIPENLTVEELSKLAKLIENPVPKSIKEIKV